MSKKYREEDHWYKPPEAVICPLCEREIPPSQADEHHLVPKLKGGKATQTLHRVCHRQIHALFTEAELAQKFNTVEALLEVEAIQKFVRWIKTKPLDFCDGARKSQRIR